MTPDQILSLYDKEQRIDVEYPGARREVTSTVVRHVPTVDYEQGFVLHSQLTAENADIVIREQADYFEQLGTEFEWKCYSHDTPPDLKDRLAAAGFEVEEPGAIMVLDTQNAPPFLPEPTDHDVRQITSVDTLTDVFAVLQPIWQDDFSDLQQRLARDLTEDPDYIRIFVAYVDNRPVSSAWVNFFPGSQFAGMWGGSTLAEYRKQGFYTALISARLRAIQEFGARFATVDAEMDTSKPILERLGFVQITTAYACMWKKGKNNS